MYNTQVNIYRMVRNSGEDGIEVTAYKERLDAFIEPAGLVMSAPIDKIIGKPFNIHIESYEEIDLREGYKIENADNNNQYYFIQGSVQDYDEDGVFHYEFIAHKPVQTPVLGGPIEDAITVESGDALLI